MPSKTAVFKYQVVKVSPGGSHLGANWEQAECYTRF